MNVPIEVSEDGNLLMYKSVYTSETVRNLIDSRQLNGLRIFDHWEPLESSDFLRDFTFLKRLEVAFRYDQDYSFLLDLPQLEHLSIGPSFPMKNSIDLSRQVNLKYLSLQWRKNRIYGLERCQNLEDLCLVEFKNSDLKLIRKLKKIVRLRIKTGSMKSLEGIENLNNLEALEIGNCRSLRSISSLSGLPQLKSIRIESCRKIEDYDDIYDLPKLRILQLVNCGPIAAFDYRQKFPNLENLQFLGDSNIKV